MNLTASDSVKETTTVKVALYLDKERNDEGKYKNGVCKQLSRCLSTAVEHEIITISCADIERGILSNRNSKGFVEVDVLYFPGGSVFAQHVSFSELAKVSVLNFVRSGGGVLGICAGALLLGSNGYDGCVPNQSFLGAQTEYMPGTGTAVIQLTSSYGRAIFGDRLASCYLTMPFSHGAWFRSNNSVVNDLLGQQLSPSIPLATFISLRQHEPHASGEHSSEIDWEDRAPIVLSRIEKGNIIAIGPHPESYDASSECAELLQGVIKYLFKQKMKQSASHR